MSNQERAQAAFLLNMTRAQAALDAINAAMQDHLGASADSVNWANVGDAGRLAESLEAVAEWVSLDYVKPA